MNAYVDRPSPRACAWAVALVALSGLDALLTLIHLHAGGHELVPTMRLALEHSPQTFLAAKLTATGVGALVLAMHERFRIVRWAFPTLLFAYWLLLVYHAFLYAAR